MMKMQLPFRLVVLSGVLLAACPVAARASSIPAVSFTDPVVVGNGGDRRTLGWEFTVSSDITVTAVGVFDAGKDGLAESHSVGLWTSAGAPLFVPVDVPGGTLGTLDGYFRYVSVTPTLLLAGETYVIGAAYTEGDPQLDSVINYPPFGSVTAFTMASGLTFVRNRQGNNGFSTVALFPTDSASVQPSYFGPNFEFTDVSAGTTAAAVPEPATLVLFGSGLAIVVARRRRNRG